MKTNANNLRDRIYKNLPKNNPLQGLGDYREPTYRPASSQSSYGTGERTSPAKSSSYNNNGNNSEGRTGMSTKAWNWVFNIVEIVTDVIKGGLVIGGIIAANLADYLMGSIAVSLLMSSTTIAQYNISGFGFGSIISMGSTAIQIFMWSLIQKRGIKMSQIFKWKTLPNDVKGFLGGALFLWAIDTFLDISPLFVLFTNENYLAFPVLYKGLVIAVSTVVLILCGFAEVLTSNMRNMLSGTK